MLWRRGGWLVGTDRWSGEGGWGGGGVTRGTGSGTHHDETRGPRRVRAGARDPRSGVCPPRFEVSQPRARVSVSLPHALLLDLPLTPGSQGTDPRAPRCEGRRERSQGPGRACETTSTQPPADGHRGASPGSGKVSSGESGGTANSGQIVIPLFLPLGPRRRTSFASVSTPTYVTAQPLLSPPAASHPLPPNNKGQQSHKTLQCSVSGNPSFRRRNHSQRGQTVCPAAVFQQHPTEEAPPAPRLLPLV